MEAVDNPSYFTLPGAGCKADKRRHKMEAATACNTPSGGTAHRRSFRALMRSMSSHSDSTQLLVLGNPRPCDLAPGHRRRASSDLNTPPPPPPTYSPTEDDGEVFLSSSGDVRYYNLQRGIPPSGRRRHSISAFFTRTESPRKGCAPGKGGRGSEVLDIAIVSSRRSEAAVLWVNYLTTCFQQISREQNRPPFKLLQVHLEDVVTEPDRLGNARLQIVVVCPHFLEACETSPTPLGGILQPGRVLAMLLGVSQDTLTLHHKAVALGFDQWRRVVVKDQDPTFVGDFLGVSMDILSRTWQIQQAINQLHADHSKAHFSLLPKKIKLGQNKVLVLLTEPLETEDKIHITVDKNGQKLEVASVKRRNPYTLQFLMPACCLQVSMLASVSVQKNGKSLGQRVVKCESRMRELDQLLRTSDNPLHFICQTLGLSPGDRDQLDLFLVSAFQRNLPPHFNLLQPATGQHANNSNEEYPTMLHFAARFGLEKLSWQLLECPGGEQACQLRNGCQLTSADMAERAGHTRLAHALKGYLQMTELSSMYNYLKGISENKQPGFSEANYLLPRPLSDTYLVPPSARPLFPASSGPSTPLDYQIPRSPASILPPLTLPPSFENYQSPPHPMPFTPPTTPLGEAAPSLPQYLDMHSPGVGSRNVLRLNLKLNTERKLLPDHHSRSADNIALHSPGASCSNRSSSSGSERNAQDELVEIINDFKNNVFTIGEVEKLVEAWRNRNDVQQSFRDKQVQLNQMRQEYERIQQAMKEDLKRPTPFERIKKFFTRSRLKSGSCSSDCGRTGERGVETVCHRPASSLSLHSSCSSSSCGRMSTGSGISLGDSGTHSDPDDSKPSSNEAADREVVKTKTTNGVTYYEIPPAPRELEEYVPCQQEVCSEGALPAGCFSVPEEEHLIEDLTVAEVYQPPTISEVQSTVAECCDATKSSEEVPELQADGGKGEGDGGVEEDLGHYKTESDSVVITCQERMKKREITGEEGTTKDVPISQEDVESSCQKAKEGVKEITEEKLSSQINSFHSESAYNCDMSQLEESEKLLKDITETLSQVNAIDLTNTENSNSIGFGASESRKGQSVLKIVEEFETKRMVEGVSMPDYVNISNYPPPPIPPRCKYTHVTL